METSNDSRTGLLSPSTNVRFKDVIVVIPADKEELVISSIILKARQHVERIIVVDNGLPGRTSEAATCAGAQVLHPGKNMGKAHALLVGLNHARDPGCKAAVMPDGDGQHKTREIPGVV